jgi:hypothetical protein
MPASAAARWEFRAWFANGAAPANPLADWSVRDEAERTDLYLVAAHQPQLLPKLRAGERLEIKERIRVDPPLQQWRVAFGADFPLGPAPLAEAVTLIAGRGARAATEAGADTRSFVACLTELEPRLMVRTVTKHRRSFASGDVVGESTEVAVAETGATAVSIAVECADPDALREALAATGLGTWPNRDYGTWLRAAAGDGRG